MAQPHQGRSSDKLINTLGTARNANGVGISDHVRPIMTNSYSTSFVSTPRTRDLAMFNLAIDSKLRGCDVVALKVEDVVPAIDSGGT
jgi:hypothetical protein